MIVTANPQPEPTPPPESYTLEVTPEEASAILVLLGRADPAGRGGYRTHEDLWVAMDPRHRGLLRVRGGEDARLWLERRAPTEPPNPLGLWQERRA